MSFRIEVLPFIAACAGAGVLLALICRAFRVRTSRSLKAGLVLFIVGSAYMLVFFRDPHRTPPAGDGLIVAGADGVVARIMPVSETRFLNEKCIRISIFLSLVDVHVNRAPIAGRSTFLGYFPGKRLFTFDDKSSEENQHNAIKIVNDRTRCLVYQIVGPIARRVVYWPDHDSTVNVTLGEPIGMMKFGSRLDMYFPIGEVEVLAKEGDRVRAGETVVARVVNKESE